MSVRSFSIFAAAILITACGSSEQTEPAVSQPAVDNTAHAAELVSSSIIIDTHIDVPYRVVDVWEDVSVATDGGDFDYPRAVAGGLNAPFMSIYTPAGLEAEGQSKEVAESLIDLVNRIVSDSLDKFAIAL